MAGWRHTSGWVALLVLAGGCNAVTDFDFEFADGGAPPMDGSVDADAADAAMDSETPPDAETDGGGGDGGGDDGGGDDAGLPDACAPPCNASVEFDAESQDDPWGYLEDGRDDQGVSYAGLTPTTLGGAPAWAPSGETSPAVVGCPLAPDAPGCAGVDDHLLFVMQAPGDGGSDPAIDIAVPSSGVYRVEVHARLPAGATPGEPAQILVSRTVRPALLDLATFSGGPVTVEAEATLLAGERIVVTTRPALSSGPAPEPLAINVVVSRVTGADFPGRCMLAVPFDDGLLANQCGGDEAVGEGPSADDPNSPSMGRLGSARGFPTGSALSWSSLSLDYGGDFTIDLWIRTEEPSDLSATALSHDSAGGVRPQLDTWTEVDGDSRVGRATVLVNDSAGSLTEFDTSRPADAEWHFYRIVRSTTDEMLRLCIDGESAGSASLGAATTVVSGDTVRIGGIADATNTFDGSIDELRITGRALPCE